MARKLLTKNLIESEYKYFLVPQKSIIKINHIKDVKNVYFA